MSDEAKAAESLFHHEPLPYVVRLRCAPKGDEDARPSIFEYRGIAYSLFEAMQQAMFEAGAVTPEDTRFRVESIGPDLPAYTVAMLRQHIEANRARRA